MPMHFPLDLLPELVLVGEMDNTSTPGCVPLVSEDEAHLRFNEAKPE